MEQLMEEFSIPEFTRRNCANEESRTGIRTGSAGLWILRGERESEERLFKLRIYPNGNRPKNEGFASVVFDLYSYDTSMPLKVTVLESDILKKDVIMSFCFLQLTVSVVNIRGELRYPQTYTMDLTRLSIKSCFPIEMDRFCSRSDLLNSSEELLPGDTLTFRFEVTCVHSTIPNDKHRKTALQEFYMHELARKESWFVSGSETYIRSWVNDEADSPLLNLRDADSLLCTRLREQSPFFEGLFRSPCKEIEDGFMAVHESNHLGFFNMLGFVRFGTLHHVKYDEEYCELYRLANVYGMRDLQEICSAYIKLNLKKECVLRILRDADSYNDADLRTIAFRHALSDWNSDVFLYDKHWIRKNLNSLRPELANELLCAAEVLDLHEEESRLCTLAARQVLLNRDRVKCSPLWSNFEKNLPDLAKVLWFFDSGVYLPPEKYKEHALEYDFYR